MSVVRFRVSVLYRFFSLEEMYENFVSTQKAVSIRESVWRGLTLAL